MSELIGFLNPFTALPVGWIIFFIIIMMAYKKLRNVVIKALTWIVNLIPATFFCILGIIAIPLWKPANKLANKILLFIPIDIFVEKIFNIFALRSKNSLIKGDRKKVALELWPESIFPYLYLDNIPDDICRPLYEDGKLIGGYNITLLADRHFGLNTIRAAIIEGITAVLLLIISAIIIAVFITYNNVKGDIFLIFSNIPQNILEQWPNQPPELIPVMWRVKTVFDIILAQSLKITSYWFNMGWYFICLLAGCFFIVTILLIRQWQKEKSAPYEFVTKDSLVLWPFRAEIREVYHNAYCKQIDLAVNYLKDSPTFFIGAASGLMRARGDLTAPIKNQDVKLDIDSLFQHLLIFGGTGEGKTTGLLKPIMRQILSFKNFGMFVCDAKGVLWIEAEQLAIKAGREKDIVIIGTGPGQYGVNLLSNLTPIQAAATLRSVLKQISGGESSNNFWADMASNLIRHVLTVAQSYAMTDDGKKSTQNGLNPYSLWWTYLTIIQEESLYKAISSVREYSQYLKNLILSSDTSDEEAVQLAQLRDKVDNPEILASAKYIEGTWAAMAKETKSGIIAHVSQLLDGFAGERNLRNLFACGKEENTINISEALEGKILLNAISNIESGLPGRLVSIFLKTLLYSEARCREVKFKALNPKKDPQKFPCVMIVDEIQEIITADPESGLSDINFWNVARSTGVAGIFATQTIAALKQSIGEKSAENFIQQARSKIFFRTEDMETMDYACWCAGKFERGRVYEDWQRESIEYRKILDLWDPFIPIDPMDEIKPNPLFFVSMAGALIKPSQFFIDTARTRNSYNVDERFIPQISAYSDYYNPHATFSSLQQAHWRAEDLERGYKTEGNEMRSAITFPDLSGMGRWHAYVLIQRAGLTRQDIVRINHDFN